MSAEGLIALVERTANTLRAHGVGQSDRIAVVLPNGPELAAAFLCVSACSVVAPLNPAYSAREFEFYLRDLEVSFLIAQEGFCHAATLAAVALDIPVIVLRPQWEKAAGSFVVELRSSARKGQQPGQQGPDDAALLLHTSGTTARPKLIPLTHRKLTSSARNIAGTLALTPADLCLNVMPLFHIHGLVGALLSSIAAGVPVFCTPGFNALQFFRLLRESRATWYTAVPTMHQMILGRPDSQTPQLRFIRSSSAHLYPKTAEQLECRFGCPALNSYGMTEASHQVSGNPLPPAVRKQGTVGFSHNSRFAILNETGEMQEPGTTGEIAICGESVMSGYLLPREANETAFHDGWFRTGDLGSVDGDGYLSLTGRIKEIINCGGEKVSPAEIDEVLLGHPDVATAICFAAPCPVLGERICAAVTLRDGQCVTEAELQNLVRDQLAKFKVPKTILILDEIPRGATGKIQRIGLAQKLGLHVNGTGE